mmetsp:Transcript_31990/g.38919  ORF Transcript_31990/g.38919 Transcript_31990/m.38919 type:complete len:324 (-) Transcript_31990:132-1103(-)
MAPNSAHAAASSSPISYPVSVSTASSSTPNANRASSSASNLASSSRSSSMASLTSLVKSNASRFRSFDSTLTFTCAPTSKPHNAFIPATPSTYVPSVSAMVWMCSNPPRLAFTSIKAPNGTTLVTLPVTSIPAVSDPADIRLGAFFSGGGGISSRLGTNSSMPFSGYTRLTNNGTSNGLSRSFFPLELNVEMRWIRLVIMVAFCFGFWVIRTIPLTYIQRLVLGSIRPTPHSKKILAPVFPSRNSFDNLEHNNLWPMVTSLILILGFQFPSFRRYMQASTSHGLFIGFAGFEGESSVAVANRGDMGVACWIWVWIGVCDMKET